MNAGDDVARDPRERALPTHKQLRYVAGLLQTKVTAVARLPRITNAFHAGEWIDWLQRQPNRATSDPGEFPQRRTDGQQCIALTVSGERCRSDALLFTADMGDYCTTHATEAQRVENRARRAEYERWKESNYAARTTTRPYATWATLSECHAAVHQALARLAVLTDPEIGVCQPDRLSAMYAAQIALSEVDGMVSSELGWWEHLPTEG